MSEHGRNEPTRREVIVPDMIFDLRRDPGSPTDEVGVPADLSEVRGDPIEGAPDADPADVADVAEATSDPVQPEVVRREAGSPPAEPDFAGERQEAQGRPIEATTPGGPTDGADGGQAASDAMQPEVVVVHVTAVKQVASIGDLIELAFRKATKQKVSKNLAKLVDVGDLAEEDVTRRLDDLYVVDPTLKGPIRVLWTVENSDLSARLRTKVLDAIEICLVQHPLVPSWNVRRVVGAEEHQVLEAVRALRSSLDSEEWRTRWPDDAKPADQQAFARNVVAATILSWALRSGTGLGVAAELLDEGVWSPVGGDRGPSKGPSMVALAESSARADFHLLYQALSTAVVQERARASEAIEEREVEARVREAVQLELQSAVALVGELERTVRQLEAELSTAAQSLREASEAERIALAHAADDFEKLRAGTLRGVSREVAMLKDALGALEDEQTKVAADFVSRAIDGLEGAAESLRAAERLREAGS
jgi:hypothetical protein